MDRHLCVQEKYKVGKWRIMVCIDTNVQALLSYMISPYLCNKVHTSSWEWDTLASMTYISSNTLFALIFLTQFNLLNNFLP